MNKKAEKSYQKNIERIYKLIDILQKEPLTKQEIFKKLNLYYKYSKEAKEKLFERDKKSLLEMGYHLEIIEKIANGNRSPAYRINDFSMLKNLELPLTRQEKEIISNILIQKIHNTKNQKLKTKLYTLYIKLMIQDIEFLKKIFNIKWNTKIESKVYQQWMGKNKLDIVINIFKNQKPIVIEYKKKYGNIVKRTIFPISIYKNHKIYYLVSYDYENSMIKNFILDNILNYNTIQDKPFKKIELNSDILTIQETINKIQIPYKNFLINLPIPFFINEKDPDHLLDIELSIRMEYLNILKEKMNIFKFGKIFKNIKITGKKNNEITISVKIKNKKSLFYFFLEYPDALIQFHDPEIQQEFRNFILDIIEFYN